MKIFRYLLPAAFAAVMGASGASAASFPVQNTQATIDSSRIEIQHRMDHRMDRRGPPPHARKGGPPPHMHRPPPRHRYVPGRRYHSPPPGWRRYGARPGDWRTRGCVMAGPIWFCP